MTTVDSARSEHAQDATTGFTAVRPTARPRRQPRWIAAGVLAVCLGGLGSALLYAEASGTREVLQVTRPLHRGEVVTAGHLRPVRVGSLPGISTVDVDRTAELVGRRALIDLGGGALLPDNSIGDSALEKGFTQVGLKLAPGRLPVGDLPPGAAVQLIPVDDPRTPANQGGQTPPSQTSQNNQAQLISAVVLTAPRVGPDGVATLLDVRVPQDRARAVAELAAVDRLVLVKEAQG
ncbi:SAF domain-containing protein [Mariniluteicoccus flavus]